MVEETIRRIEKRIQAAPAMRPENKSAVLELLEELRDQVRDLPSLQEEQALSVVGFAEVTAHEAIKEVHDRNLFKLAVTGLRKSVDDFEQTHPRLVDIVNSISTTLSNMGI